MALWRGGRMAAVMVACGMCVAAGYLARSRLRPASEPRESLDGVHAAVAKMRRLARAAEPRLEPGRLAAIQTEGEHAIGELGRQLGRLWLARDAHDRAGHAIGAMVLHAGAAQSLRATDPVRARDAVRTVHAAGADALSELELLGALHRNFRSHGR